MENCVTLSPGAKDPWGQPSEAKNQQTGTVPSIKQAVEKNPKNQIA